MQRALSGTGRRETPSSARAGSDAALVLANPAIDPKARSWIRLLAYWRLDGRYPTPGLTASHKPEWRRAGWRRLINAVQAHFHDHLDDTVPRLSMPVPVLRGRDDRLLSPQWARHLASLAPHGRLEILPGPHTFPWSLPRAGHRSSALSLARPRPAGSVVFRRASRLPRRALGSSGISPHG